MTTDYFECPCCGGRTLEEPGTYEICPDCGWEDDGQDDEDGHDVWGGPGGDLSLAQARKNFVKFGNIYAVREDYSESE